MRDHALIVTHCHTRIGFHVARDCTAAGWRVVAAARRVPSMCARLPGVVGQIAYPDPYDDIDGYLSALLAGAERHDARLLLPVHEEIFPTTRHRGRLAPKLAVVAPSFERLLVAHDKLNVPAFAARAGVPTPLTRLLKGPDDLDPALAEIGFPAVIKPRFGSGASRTMVLRDRAGAAAGRDRLLRALGERHYIAQSWAKGIGVGFGGLTWGGEVLALSGHRRLREVPITGGTSTARLTFDHSALSEAAIRLMRELGLDGVAMCEFRFDPESGAFALLEFNPRYWGGVTTAIQSGVGIARLHLAAALGEPPPLEQPVRPTRIVESRWVLGEIRAAAEMLRAGRLNGALRIFRRDGAAPVLLDDFELARPGPFLAELAAYLQSLRQHGNFGGHSRGKERFFLAPEGVE